MKTSSINVPLAFFTLFFLANGLLGYFAAGKVADNEQLVNESLQHVNNISELQLEILRAESGQRGYLLTDLESYVEPYNLASGLITEKIRNLEVAALDDVQIVRFQELKNVIAEKLIEMSDAVTAIRANRDNEAIQNLFTHRGRNLMEEISMLIGTMVQYERDVLQERLFEAQQSRVSSFYLVLTANVVGLIMVFISLSLIRISRRKEQELLVSLQEAKDDLEHKVEERTAALQHFSNELKRSNRELQEFAFVASHDLQEPLRKIQAFGSRLDHVFNAQLGEKGKDYIQRMQNASSRMSQLIEDLLSFSRITSNNNPFIPVNLEETLLEVLEDMEIAIEEAGASIHHDALPEVEANRFQMKQLFQNLVGNAIKFRHPDVAPVINIAANLHSDPENPARELLTITVRDNGIGFDDKFVDRIFLPFQRLHGKEEFSGTGIGLAICRRIVERHNGSITASSTPGAGTSVEFTLPVRNRPANLEDNL